MTSTPERDDLLMTLILAACEDLGPEYREVMRLSYVENLDLTGVARRMGREPAAVQSIKHMALDRARRVRECFERIERGEDPNLAAFIALARYAKAPFIQYASDHATRLAHCYSDENLVLLLDHSHPGVREVAVVLAPQLKARRQ